MARPRGFDIDEAVKRAMLLFWEKGYQATSLSDIQRDLDIGRASLYAAFGDKESLFLKALALYRERYTSTLSVLDQDAPAMELLQKLFNRLAALYTGASTPQGCLVLAASLECGTAQDTVGQAVSALIAYGEDKLQRTLMRAQKEGSLSRDADVKAIARFLMASSQGMAALARRGGSRKDVEDVGRRVLSSLRR